MLTTQSDIRSGTPTISAVLRRRQEDFRSMQGRSGAWIESKTWEKRDDVVDASSRRSLINQRMLIWKGLTQVEGGRGSLKGFLGLRGPC